MIKNSFDQKIEQIYFEEIKNISQKRQHYQIASPFNGSRQDFIQKLKHSSFVNYYFKEDNQQTNSLIKDICQQSQLVGLNIIALKSYFMTNDLFNSLAESMINLKNLKYLNLDLFQFSIHYLNKLDLVKFGENLSTLDQLTTFRFSIQISLFPLQSAIAINRGLQNKNCLTNLEFKFNCISISNNDLSGIKSIKQLLEALQYFTNLISFTFSIFRLIPSNQDRILFDLSKGLRNTRKLQNFYLNLHNTQIITKDEMNYFRESILSLKDLSKTIICIDELKTMPDLTIEFINIFFDIQMLKELYVTLKLNINCNSTVYQIGSKIKSDSNLQILVLSLQSRYKLQTAVDFYPQIQFTQQFSNLQSLKKLAIQFIKFEYHRNNYEILMNLFKIGNSIELVNLWLEDEQQSQNLRRILTSLKQLSNLQRFSFRCSSMSKYSSNSFGSALREIKSLKKLHLNECLSSIFNKETMTDTFRQLSNLQQLKITQNSKNQKDEEYISIISEVFVYLKSLKKLKLTLYNLGSEQNFQLFANNLKYLTNLQYLSLQFGQVVNYNISFFQGAGLEMIQNLTHLTKIFELQISLNILSSNLNLVEIQFAQNIIKLNSLRILKTKDFYSPFYQKRIMRKLIRLVEFWE